MFSDNPGFARAKRFFKQILGKDMWIYPQVQLETVFLGSRYGGYAIQGDGLNRDSIVYSFGLGEDITFDLALMDRCGCAVYGYDPTPKAMAWIGEQQLPKRFKFKAVGLADYDGMARFASPRIEKNVSFSMARESSTHEGNVEMPVACLGTLMGQNGHTRCDLLKMDIEGAEYKVLKSLVQSKLSVDQIVLEFHPEMVLNGFRETLSILNTLNTVGYRIFAISPDGRDFSLKFMP